MAYIAKPDRGHISDRKAKALQKRMNTVEKQMLEQALLRKKLEELADLESSRTQKAIDKASSRNMVLKDEIDRIYGPSGKSPSPVPNKAIQEILAQRTKEFERSQAQKQANIQYLAQERERILEARSRLREKHGVFRSLPSPVGSDISEILMKPPSAHTPSYRSVHSADSNVRKAIDDMPDAVDRIWNLREGLHQDYVKMKRPYAGELGIESYQPWQIPDFIMVRRLLEEFVDDFIFKHIPADYAVYERDMKLQMLNKNDKDWNKTSKALAERSAVQLVSEELLLEITSKMIKDIAMEGIHQDVMFKRMSSNMFIKEAEVQATGNPNGRDPSDDAYDLITRTFYTIQKNRDHHKKAVWVHSQLMEHPAVPPPIPLRRDPVPDPPKPASKKGKAKPDKKVDKKPSKAVPAPPVVEEYTPPPTPPYTPQPGEPLEADMVPLTYDHLFPEDQKILDTLRNDDAQEKNRKLWTTIYKKTEVSYWNKLRPFVFSTSVGKRCQGVTVLRPSPDHMQLAVGTVSGDVVVFNTQVEPWAAVKMDIGQQADGAVIHLAWSLDSYRLLAVKKSGSLHVWSTKGVPASKDALKAMDFTTDDAKAQPFALVPIHSMDARKGDFTITEGSLKEKLDISKEQKKAVIADFFPSLTFLTTQHSVCSGLHNGDILKLDTETVNAKANAPKSVFILKQKLEISEDEPNKNKQSVGAELLQQHKHPIIHMGFVGNIGKLITVDEKGFINIWKYDRAHVTGFDWIFPEKKYKLSLSKTMYSPSSSDRARLIFTDRNRSKTTSKSQILKERMEAQGTLDKMQLGDPWHVSVDKAGYETSVYIPHGGTNNTGAMFNVIVRHGKTKQLSIYMTRMYKPVKVPCSKLVTVTQSPSGNELVFVLAFPEYPPKGPHLMILVLHLPTMKFRNLRKDIELTAEELKEISEGKGKICCSDMSQVYGPTGSDYLFLTLNGRLTCISLNTGSVVMRADSVVRSKAPPFLGLRIDDRQVNLSRSHQVATLGNYGSLYAVLYEQSSTTLRVLRLEDGNGHEDSRLMCKAYKKWEGYNPQSSEMRINPVNWTLPDMKHNEAEMRSLLLSLPYIHEQITPDEQLKEKVGNYFALQEKVDKEGLLDYL